MQLPASASTPATASVCISPATSDLAAAAQRRCAPSRSSVPIQKPVLSPMARKWSFRRARSVAALPGVQRDEAVPVAAQYFASWSTAAWSGSAVSGIPGHSAARRIFAALPISYSQQRAPVSRRRHFTAETCFPARRPVSRCAVHPTARPRRNGARSVARSWGLTQARRTHIGSVMVNSVP